MQKNSQKLCFFEQKHLWAQARLSLYRHTIQESINWSGVGVHQGQRSKVALYPYFPKDTKDLGPIFCGYPLAEWSVVHSAYATCLAHPQVGQKQMTEHLFAALYAAGIDDVIIEVDGDELPILDGSAWTYLQAISPSISTIARQWVQLPPSCSLTWLQSNLRVSANSHHESHHESATSSQHFSSQQAPLQVTLHLDLPLLAPQSFYLSSFQDLYEQVIPAKTFGFLKDEAHLRSLGLIKAVSYENTRVYDEQGQVLNPPFIPNESAAHKILDFLGDLYRLPYSVKGKIHIERGSHELNHRFIDLLMQSKIDT